MAKIRRFYLRHILRRWQGGLKKAEWNELYELEGNPNYD